MPKVIILKLGGSIITEKRSGKPVLKAAFVKKAAKEVSLSLKQKPGLKLVLLHGAGSFGHPLVYKYRLKNKPLKTASFAHIGEVVRQLRNLGNELAKIFIKAGLPVFPLQTSSLFQRNNGKTILKNFSVIETPLARGGIPLLGGDLVVGGSDRVYVLSADEIAVLLAKRVKNSQIFFASDVDGVYESFPPLKGERPIRLLNRNKLKSLIGKNGAEKLQSRDVSGRMFGKLKHLTTLKNKKAFIFNGQRPHLISKALKGAKVKGTTVLL